MQNTPVNVDILTITPTDLTRLGQVKELQIFGQGSNFHADGLFSVSIFGQVGSEVRNRTFGYITLNFTALHPIIYKAITSATRYYAQILSGEQTAIWNTKTHTFDKDNSDNAQTGYSFFMQHIHELKFTKQDSDKRNFMIDLYNKANKENKLTLQHLLVMPAGMRDYTISPNGKPEEDEINSIYRRILSQSQLIDPAVATKSPDVYDNIYDNIQSTLQELYDHLQSLFDGKNKLILAKWLGRTVFNSTRNVLCSQIDSADNLHDVNRLRSNDVGVGLYQYLRAISPKSLFFIKTKYLSKVFQENSPYARLTNTTTLKSEEVSTASIQKDIDLWTTTKGLESVIANFGNLDIRHLPLLVNKGKHCLGLIYNDGKRIRYMQSIDELPEGYDKKHVTLMTMAELLYMSVAHTDGQLPGLVTRYPINGYGGIYPAFMRLRTTSAFNKLQELDENWQETDVMMNVFPKKDSEFINGVSMHQSHLARAGADHDGDTISIVGLLTDEAIEETKRVLNSTKYYFDDKRRVIFGNNVDVLAGVMAYMTK